MKNISHLNLFIDSLIHPKKLAAYRILSIGKVIQYTFLLVALVTAFSLGQFVNNGADSIFGYEEIQAYIADLKWLIYIVSALFLFIMNTLIVYAKISVYAYVGYLLAKPASRRVEYRHMWRTAAFAITWEILLSLVFSTIQLSGTTSTLISIFLTMFIIIVALTKYPTLKK